MLTGGQFYDLLCAVVPLYIALFLGYGSLKWWSVLTPEQSAGIGRLNSFVAMPALVFQIIAFNNPYTMNNRLISAYCLSNIIILGAVLAWAWFAKSGGLDWAITLFQLAALSNTIIVGIPVLTPLYSITTQGIPAIFIGQVLWLFVILFLYEVWGAMSERAAVTPVMTEVLGSGLEENITEHASSVPNSLDHDLPALVTDTEHDECRINMNGLSMKSVVKIECADGLQGVEEKCGDMRQQESNGRDKKDENVNESVPVQMNFKKLAVKVVKKMVKLPLTPLCSASYIPSLRAGVTSKAFPIMPIELLTGLWFSFQPPRVFNNSLDIIARMSLGLTMYTIGLFMAGEKKLIASWWIFWYGAFFRFIVGPASMALASYVLGIRGDTLRLCFAALPQAVVSFVFAKEKNCHTNVFSTAVSIQTLCFVPIVLGYYTLFNL